MAILGVIFNFFYVAFFVMCGTMGYLFHVWGSVGVLIIVFGRFGGPEKGLAGQRPALTGWLLRRLLLLLRRC